MDAITKTRCTDSLSAIATEINSVHRDALSFAGSALEAAYRVGNLLREAKSQIERGEWQRWLLENCDVSIRQAQRYMRVAKEWGTIHQNDAASFLSIDQAIELTRPPAGPRSFVCEMNRIIQGCRERICELRRLLDSTTTLKAVVAIQNEAAEWQNIASEIRLRFERAAGRLLGVSGGQK